MVEEKANKNGPTLPIELWYYITSMVRRDVLFRLSRTNRTLRSICLPYFYNSISLSTPVGGNLKRMQLLVRSIQNSHLADLVTCLGHDPLSRSEGHPDYCRPINHLVGKLVVPLRNLRELAFLCKMCSQDSCLDHSYLRQLETKVLTKLELNGECFRRDHRLTLPILSAPCMRGITTLDLRYETSWDLEPAEQALIEDDSFLPCLRKLSSPTFKLFTSHLRKGSIKNIYIRSDHSDLSTILSNSLPGVMYLYQECIKALIPSIMGNPSPYLKLRSIGRFTFREVHDVSTKPSNYAHF